MDIFGQNWWKKHFCKNLKYFWKIEGVYEIRSGKSHNAQQEGDLLFQLEKRILKHLKNPFLVLFGDRQVHQKLDAWENFSEGMNFLNKNYGFTT